MVDSLGDHLGAVARLRLSDDAHSLLWILQVIQVDPDDTAVN